MTMTNNPTIDGVSRALIENAANYMEGSASAQVNIWRRELRALLDAPIEPFNLDGWGIDHSAGRPVLVHNKCSVIETEQAYGLLELINAAKDAPEVAALQSTIARLEDRLSKAIDLDFQRRETIEQLQARIGELESGVGEPVAEVQHGPFDDVGAPQWVRVVTLDDFDLEHIPDGTKLFTAPPALVEVSIDEQQAFADWTHEVVGMRGLAKVQRRDEMTVDQEKFALRGWLARACLDATAALNKSH